MENRINPAGAPTKRGSDWLIAAFIMLIVMAVNGGLMVALLQRLSWTECALVVLTGALLSGGLLFTVVTMWNLPEKR